MNVATGVLGFFVMLGLAWAFSRRRGEVQWLRVARGVLLQVVLAVLILRVPGVREGFQALASGVEWFLGFADHGARFLFGPLVDATLPVTVEGEEGESRGFAALGSILILKILPTIIFVSSMFAVLFHLGILPRLVGACAWLVRSVLGVSGAEALAATANVFLGLTEAPLLVRPYLVGMTRSELMAVMVGGFATISGSMMAIYSSVFGVELSHLLAASVLNAPAALYLTKIYLPETETPQTLGGARVHVESDAVNVIDAASGGAALGLRLALNIGAMLLAFAAGIHLVDALLGALGNWILPTGETLSLGRIFGWIFLPLAWLLGVPGADCPEVGSLLGTKIALNEYFAYQMLQETELAPRSRLIATYALCGFANFGTMAILMGGLGGLVPDRRQEIARRALVAMLLGALSNCLTAALAGVILPAG